MGTAVRTLLSPRRWPILKTLLVLLNLMSTWLTVWLGLRESPLVAWATGRHDTMRQRLLTGGVTTEIAELKHFRLEDLAQPKELADYTFFWTPRRDPSNIGESRTVCLTMNTNTAPSMMLNFDDYWGKAARRVQIRINSISSPYCQVLNVRPAWRDQCVKDNQGNATLCHQFMLDNFDGLRNNFTVRMAVVRDIGSPGVPFLRCESRPLTAFKFKADLLAYQTYWSGSDYFLSIQTSDCMAMPLARTKDRTYTLFQTVNVDEACEMLYLLPTGAWLTELVRWGYSLVTVVLIIQGIALGLFRTNTVSYLPHGLRIGKKRRWLRYALPFMELINRFSDNDRSIVTFKGSMLVVSDVWMTHWLYIWLSILDALVNLRATYVTYQVATSLLVFKFTLGNLVFLCTALIKITWLVCLVQTIVRLLIKLAARCLRSARLIRSITREKMEWNADGISILLSYRIYYVMMFILTYVLIKVKGDPTFMKRAAAYKTPAYGGVEDLAGFWGSELACDLVTLIGILTVISQVIGIGLMYTRFKHVADNGVMRLLQRRYFFSGWDGLLASQMLGLDVSDPDIFVDGRAYTKFTIGSLLQLLYQSGPSGFVHLAGDYIFHDNGFSRDPVRFKYAIPKAMGMGILNTGKGSVFSTGAPNGTEIPTAGRPQGSTGNTAAVAAAAKYRTADELAAAQAAKRSIFDRRLRIASESYLGKLLFIDATQPGQLTTNKETGHREYEVVDAMTTMTILDIKYLMGREKKIRVE